MKFSTFQKKRVVMATIGSLGDLHPYISLALEMKKRYIEQGGVGTTGQGLRAGIPMLVLPFAHDQHDNGWRVERLGVARTIARNSYKAERVASELKELLGNPAYSRNAREIGSRVRSERGAAHAADLILDRLNERRSDRFRLRTVA